MLLHQVVKLTNALFSVGNSVPGQEDQDISPYATFHLLGMREEAKRQAEAAQMMQGHNINTSLK